MCVIFAGTCLNGIWGRISSLICWRSTGKRYPAALTRYGRELPLIFWKVTPSWFMKYFPDFGPPVGRDDVRRAEEVPRVRERAACVPQRRGLPVHRWCVGVDQVPVQVGRNIPKWESDALFCYWKLSHNCHYFILLSSLSAAEGALPFESYNINSCYLY